MAITNLDELVANISLVEVPAEHGTGAIGSSDFGAPRTYRATKDGVIITQIKIDLSGLYDGSATGDGIGLASKPCYIGQNVIATNGVIYKIEMSCIETPATGDADIMLVENTSGAINGDDAVGTSHIAGDNGELAAGETYQNLKPELTDDYYYYLTTGATNTATYSAGQFIITTWGHASLD